ncbi:MAG: acetylornithine deacetylase [Deltaproteobacteria bacterium]|nr:acetylornithine deacetylase [Deltaproteobacteria bacterium]
MPSKESVVDLLGELVGYPTVSNRPVDAIAAALAQRAEDTGARITKYETEPGKANVVARFGPPGTDGLVLSGHMDVVPTEGQNWSSDPFKMVERDNALYGRGTADMKGFLAAVSVAIAQIPTKQLKRELVLIWTHDEEVGCHGSRVLAERWADDISPLPSLAWIGEPTDMKICRMHPGHTTIEVLCTGRPAHSSRPSLGLNAIHLAQRVLAVLEGVAADWKKTTRFAEHLPSPFTVMNVGTIQGGSAINIVPDSCSIHIGIRPLPGEDAQQRVDSIRSALEPVKAHARHLGGDIDIRHIQTAPALLTQPDTELEQLLRPHACQPQPTGAPFATDGGNLTSLGISSLIFGPGSIDVAHRPDEYIAIKDLHQCVETVRSVVHARCILSQGA